MKYEFQSAEKSACGVGFIVSRHNLATHSHVQKALHALRCVEHRGACAADQITGDGAGIMTDIPFELFGYEKSSIAVASLFTPTNPERKRKALRIFEETFGFLGLKILEYRNVPVDTTVLGPEALESMPGIIHAIIQRPEHCSTDSSFDKLLYAAKQFTRTKEKENGISKEFFFTSLSAKTITYKALTKAKDLDRFYLDLQNPTFKTRFALFHRRFSTNTKTSWDKVQPFRLIGHNGEINTIAGNRSWAYSRERYLGLRPDELLTHTGISDSGSLNEMVEALMYRSSIPHVEDILALMMPPADGRNPFYRFWSRAMEPWDGPAFITYSDGASIGARLDRNGFRPCRWTLTDEHFYLSSEAGSFEIDEATVLKKGTLHAGTGVKVDIDRGEVHFRDPSQSRENFDANFDPRLTPVKRVPVGDQPEYLHKKHLFNYSDEDVTKVLVPMITEGKEPIGSMGDTARPAILSDEPRSFFDYFYQNFAQVTNPPLDYIREEMVTDLAVYLGKKPNIFEKKELIPPAVAYELKSPILSLAEMKFIRSLDGVIERAIRVKTRVIDTTFDLAHGVVGLNSRIEAITRETCQAVTDGFSIIVLSDEKIDTNRAAIPCLLALRAIVNKLNETGQRLNASLVVHSGEVKSTHHVAALVGFGASAVCPYMALEIARFEDDRKLRELDPDSKEKQLIKAFDGGLLKIMAKMGISVVRSYQSAKLFTAVGIGRKLSEDFFPGLYSPIGGIEMPQIYDAIVRNMSVAAQASADDKLIKTYFYKEHNKGTEGEKHAMTNTRSKLIHELVRETGFSLKSIELFNAYLKMGEDDSPLNIRHLFDLKKATNPLSLDKVQSQEAVLKTFGSGAMSFGAISAESQRDIFLAMREIGGRSNSGEGGENPFYFTDGITASAKQVASGRFGVTAEYLVSGNEFQIKVAQGAKPGEGGQLMGVKVNDDIAKARYASVGVDLISPPPLHDIYSIEDLKELIYELKQLKPDAVVNVKLVAGANIGTVAVGVAKAGADVIHISGGDGGTGAATLSSMKHAGLPFEFGLVEVHKALIANNLRKNVKLRTDGGLHTGKDVVMASIMGAEEFEFGKLLLVAEGCVMARICEKNTCPTGIATHDPKFKAKYKGHKDHVVATLQYIAEDVRRYLSLLGVTSLDEVRGRTDLLLIHEKHQELVYQRNLDLSFFLGESTQDNSEMTQLYFDGVSQLNQEILTDCKDVITSEGAISLKYPIYTTDRAAMATLSGEIARKIHLERLRRIREGDPKFEQVSFDGNIHIEFSGSAGQGFGVFMVEGIETTLYGEANDSVCKSMSGGKATIRPSKIAAFRPEENAIIGNCALYGATGGTLYVSGLAGDRFAVRNSGAIAVVEGTGLHACEYMTNGTVVILGPTSKNIGAGMTGGRLFIYGDQDQNINKTYIDQADFSEEDLSELKNLLQDYHKHTGSNRTQSILNGWDDLKTGFRKYLPVKQLPTKHQEMKSSQSDHKAA
jgi:glutamate synthase domain-containing protein 2/glutamate synthase domain-containing protein 1/glutamate synthase domain-containing protein 3